MTPEERARLIEKIQTIKGFRVRILEVTELEAILSDLRRVDVLEKALASMIGTHGEPCVHYPCDALKLAKQALGDA